MVVPITVSLKADAIHLMRALGVSVEALTARAEALRQEGQTVVLVSVDGRAAGLLGVEDPVKASTPEALARLHIDPIDYQGAYYYAEPKQKATIASLDELDPEIKRECIWAGVKFRPASLLVDRRGC